MKDGARPAGEHESKDTGAKRSDTLLRNSFIGMVCGVLAGVFFGDLCSVLQPIGDAYVMLLEMVVYPYLISLLIHGLGRLTPDLTKKLVYRSGPFFIIAWVITIALIYTLATVFPEAHTRFTLPGTGESGGISNMLSLLIPANPFRALVNNQIPSIVLFSAAFGLAIQHHQKKEKLLDTLDTLKSACVKIWSWVVMLAPLAIFALLASTVGTAQPENLKSLLVYLALFMGGTALLALWIFPVLLSCLIPRGYREIMGDLRDAFVVSLSTALSVAALPAIIEAAKKLVRDVGIEDDSRDEITETTLFLSYVMGQLGNLFVLLFILFAGFYFSHPVPLKQQILLPGMTLLSTIGSPSATVSSIVFLSDWLGLPHQAAALYVEMMSVTRYGQILATVAGFGFITFGGIMAFYGRLNIRWKALMLHATAILAVFIGTAWMMHGALKLHDQRMLPYSKMALEPGIVSNVRVQAGKTEKKEPVNPSEDAMVRLERTGVLRVGYNDRMAPFCYRNEKRELVGFDVAMAYKLADDLGCALEFVPFDWSYLEDDIAKGRFDVALSEVMVTKERLGRVAFTQPYINSTLVLVVRDRCRDRYEDYERCRERSDLVLAAKETGLFQGISRACFPHAQLVIVPEYDRVDKEPSVEGFIWTDNLARAWVAQHPGYSIIRPGGLSRQYMIALMVSRNSPLLLQFLNYWLTLESVRQLREESHSYWILRQPLKKKRPRWSVMRNVLGW